MKVVRRRWNMVLAMILVSLGSIAIQHDADALPSRPVAELDPPIEYMGDPTTPEGGPQPAPNGEHELPLGWIRLRVFALDVAIVPAGQLPVVMVRVNWREHVRP